METLGGLVEPAQVVEYDGAVQERLGEAIVDFQRLIELLERAL